jgi:hypothetical protein
MSIDRGDFDSISVDDMEQLVVGQVPEGLYLEYKRELYGSSGDNKRELLKDVSAFANSHGGHLLLGIDEDCGAASNVNGVECLDPDAEILRMEQILRSGLEPVISGIQIKSVTVSKDRYVFVIRVPRSWRSPHRVVAKSSNRFYLRHSAGIHEPSVEELRALFNQSSIALDMARTFRDDRISRVCSGEGERPLQGNGRIFLHIAPVAGLSNMVNLDLEKVHSMHQHFWPISSESLSTKYNYYGFKAESIEPDNYCYTQVFRNGCLEATKAGLLQQHNNKTIIYGKLIEQSIFNKLSKYIFGLRDLGVPPPLIIMITFEGINNAYYRIETNTFADTRQIICDNILMLPECYLEDYGEKVDHHRSVRPAFDALWNTIGYSKSQYFNDDDKWVGEISNRG